MLGTKISPIEGFVFYILKYSGILIEEKSNITTILSSLELIQQEDNIEFDNNNNENMSQNNDGKSQNGNINQNINQNIIESSNKSMPKDDISISSQSQNSRKNKNTENNNQNQNDVDSINDQNDQFVSTADLTVLKNIITIDDFKYFFSKIIMSKIWIYRTLKPIKINKNPLNSDQISPIIVTEIEKENEEIPKVVVKKTAAQLKAEAEQLALVRTTVLLFFRFLLLLDIS